MERQYVIYKLKCLSNDLVYIGSTADYTCRKNQHKTVLSYKSGKRYDLSLYQIMRANGGWNNWVMYPIEELNTTKMQIRIREQHYIEQHKDCINHINAYTSEEDKKKHKKEMNKEYYRKKKERANRIQTTDATTESMVAII